MESKQSRTFWTFREKRDIATEVYNRIKSGNKSSLIKLVNEAQIVHIEDKRRRKIISTTQLSWLKSELAEVELRDLESAKEKSNIESQVVDDIVVISPPPDIDSLVRTMIDQRVSEYLSSIVEPLAKTIAEIAAKQDIICRLLGSLIKEVPTPLPTVPVERVRRPIVLIAGANADQLSEITSEFSNKYDIRGISLDLNVKRIHEISKGSAAVIAMTNFISHSVDSCLKGHKHYIRVAGGVSSVKRVLDNGLLI